jgi:hypothetical protein
MPLAADPLNPYYCFKPNETTERESIMNNWTQALAENLTGNSFFSLKLMLRGGVSFDRLMERVPSFITRTQAQAAIHSAIKAKRA